MFENTENIFVAVSKLMLRYAEGALQMSQVLWRDLCTGHIYIPQQIHFYSPKKTTLKNVHRFLQASMEI